MRFEARTRGRWRGTSPRATAARLWGTPSRTVSQIARAIRRTLAGEGGATAGELALVVPIFFMLILGAVDLGQAVVLRNMASEAARDGARQAQIVIDWDAANTAAGNATPPSEESTITDNTLKTAITAAPRSKAGAYGSKLNVSTTAGGDATNGYYVRVHVTSSYLPITSTLLHVGTIQISASSKLYLG